jgi:hypothetical protein
MKNLKIALICFVAFLASCNPNQPSNVSNIPLNLGPVRFDQLFYSMDSNQVKQGMFKLLQQHEYFTDAFTINLLGWGKVADTSNHLFSQARYFLTNSDYVNLQKTVNQKFPDTKSVDASLTTLFQHIKYYFPSLKVPKLYYYNCGLHYRMKTFTYDTLVAVGLHMYLGKDFEFYPSVDMPDYEIARCTPENIPVDVAHTMYQFFQPLDLDGKTLLDVMLQRGKELYFLDQVMPDAKEFLKIGYSESQLKWCSDNQLMIWNMFKQNELLYQTNMQKIRTFVSDGPNTQGLPLECPGNAGSYIGWQIIKAYCKKNPPKSLEAFVQEPIDAQAMLQASGYSGR